MWSNNFSKTGSRIAFMLGQFLVLMLCVVYIEYVYQTNILPDKEAKETFHQSLCFLISKKLSSRGELHHKYRADFLISYNVNGAQYNRWVSGNGLDMTYSGNQADQEMTLSQFDEGKTYVCWYDPMAPQIAMLLQRHNWLSTFPLMLPSVVFLITLYYFLKSLLVLLEAKVVEVKRAKKQKK